MAGREKQILVLVGPKGAGKTTLGSLIERAFGPRFVRAEAIWIDHGRSPPSVAWEREGTQRVTRAITAELARHDSVVVETTGASAWTGEFLDGLRAMADVRLLRVHADLDDCAKRLRQRAPSDHVPVSEAQLAAINSVAATAVLPVDATFSNQRPWDEAQVRAELGELLARLGMAAAAIAPTLQSRRLVLRPWRDTDAEPFARMNADPTVMEHFPSLLSPGESDALMGRIRGHFDRYGFGLWVVEVPGLSSFAGFVGLGVPPFAAAFTPCVEIGWRLDAAHWGRGFATEAAAAAVTFAFESLALPGLVSFTSPRNARSTRVMRAIGMTHAPEEDFDHPRVAAGHPLSRHVLYRLSAVRWREATGRPAFGPSTRERAEAFASALDADEFERARPLVSPHCSYEVRGVSWHGPDAILGSYADATRSARTLVDEVRYQSRVSALTERALDVHFTDVLLHAGREHRHRCVQHLSFGPDGLVERIVHEDLPGERAALAAFLSGVGAG